LGSVAHSGGELSFTTLTPGSSSAVAVPNSRAARIESSKAAEHDRHVPLLQAETLHHLDAERTPLRRLLRPDIAAADLVDRRRHRHVLIHHLDAGLGRLLRKRQDRRLARVAHHRDAVGMGRDRRCRAGPFGCPLYSRRLERFSIIVAPSSRIWAISVNETNAIPVRQRLSACSCSRKKIGFAWAGGSKKSAIFMHGGSAARGRW
jgi:hypothetical protein